VGADESAPVTFREADSFLRQAEEVLEGDRYQRTEARSLAQAAGGSFRHSTYIAEAQREVEDGKKGAVERLILEHEQSLVEIAESIGAEANLSGGWGAASKRVIAAATSLAEDRRNVQRELEETGKRAAELDARLAAIEARKGDLDAELQARKKREEAIREIRMMLGPADATVLESEEELIIRLHGMGFPVGSSEIQPRDFPLLTKLQRCVRTFPGAPVVIEGHTDAQGDEDYNQALSQRRAAAVTAYLTANMAGEEERFSSIGFGESRPIVTNETEEGRAKNRRIDVRIATSEVTGG
jgi:outer membrane protein OmpA-like peptidoglycan-associated protein